MTTAQKTVMFAGGRKVSAIGMGSWHLGQGRHSAQQEEAALKLGLDLGLNLMDTAEMYGEGRSETLIGRAIAGRRDDVFLVSKVYPWHANRKEMASACEQSLSRLKTDHLDLYLLHWHADTPIDETIEAFEKLRAAGKIRAWGVSNFDTNDMRGLLERTNGKQCASDQVLYNVATRGIEHALLPWCAQHHIPVMGYSPLGSGGGLLRDPVLAQIARKHQVSPAAIALAWAIRGGNVVAIPESGEPAHIRENAAVLTLNLDPEDLATIDAHFQPPRGPTPLAVL